MPHRTRNGRGYNPIGVHLYVCVARISLPSAVGSRQSVVNAGAIRIIRPMRKWRPFGAACVMLIGLFAGKECLAVNPFLPSWEYIPDGEPRVFGDRVYLYGSHDRAGSKKFCDYILKVWSAPLNDLNNWRDEGISSATRDAGGHADDVPWSDNELYAPDVVEKGGKYYLYAYIVRRARCRRGERFTGRSVQAALQDHGPARIAPRLRRLGRSMPIPACWWTMTARSTSTGASSSRTWPSSTRRTCTRSCPAPTRPTSSRRRKPFKFFEAISPRKINGTYYMIYADGGILTYATSKSPTGPFKYGGHIIGNGRDYPGGNNHGSLCNLNGQWYIFYHRMTNNTVFSRKACVERVTIEADGSIKEVEQTSLGFQRVAGPVPAPRRPRSPACSRAATTSPSLTRSPCAVVEQQAAAA